MKSSSPPNSGAWIIWRFPCTNKKYVLWNVYLTNALHSLWLNRLSCSEVGIYNGANSPNGFLTPTVAYLCTLGAQCLLFSNRLTQRLLRGSRISKSRSRDPADAHVDIILHFFVRSPSGQFVCQIWSFYLQPFPRYAEGPKILEKVTWPFHDPFWPYFAFFFVRNPSGQSAC